MAFTWVAIFILFIGTVVYFYFNKDHSEVLINEDTLPGQESSSVEEGLSTIEPGVVGKTIENAKSVVYVGARYGFSYPSNWDIQEVNSVTGHIIIYPKDKSEKIINKTISVSDRINVSLVDNKYVDLSNTKITVLSGETWYIKNTSVTDGGTEDMIEYYKAYNSTQYVVVNSGVSNESVIELILSSWKQG